MLQPNKNFFLAVVIAPVPFLFLTSYSLKTQVMLILILNDAQYLPNAFSFEKTSNSQNHLSTGSHYPIKNPASKIFHQPPSPPTAGGILPPLNAIWKTLMNWVNVMVLTTPPPTQGGILPPLNAIWKTLMNWVNIMVLTKIT